MAASTEQIELLELFQIQNDEGPCLDCFHTGAVVVHDDLERASPWPQFAAESVRAGFPSVCAVPLRLKAVILGCLNLFMSEPVLARRPPTSPSPRHLPTSPASPSSRTRPTREAAIREGQLQHALNSRIAIEQAKGMIAERAGVDMDAAFSVLRRFARNNNRGLTEVAEALVSGTLKIDALTRDRRHPPPPPHHRLPPRRAPERAGVRTSSVVSSQNRLL